MKNRQRGATLITAIFLITAIAMLAAIGVQMGASQRQTVNFAALGDRAYAAAQSGLEYGAYRALVANTCPAGFTDVNLTEGALNGFRVRVRCATHPVQANDCPSGVPYSVYNITAFAQRGNFGMPEYVSRTLERRFTNASC